MLDRIDAGLERRGNPIFAVRVRGGLPSEQVRRVDDGLHLVVEQLLTQPAGDVAVDPAGGGELDDVGTLRDLIADGTAAVVRAAAQVRRAGAPHLRNVAVRVVGGVAVPARDDGRRAARRLTRTIEQGSGVDVDDAVCLRLRAQGGVASVFRQPHRTGNRDGDARDCLAHQ